MRALAPVLLLAVGVLGAAETPVPATTPPANTPPALAPYAIAPGPLRQYLALTEQQVSWESAGDKLTFTSMVGTRQLWKCTKVADGTATVEATITRVIANHEGPGAEHAFDSAERTSSPDALLGHLKALEGVTLTYAIDLASGATRVTGGAAIAAGVAKRSPNLVDPLAPSPLAAQAAQLYGDANLSRIWSQVLARPAAQPQPVPLGEPLSGSLLRTWSGTGYTLGGTVQGTAVLARDPTPVEAAVSEVAGSGKTELGADGWPGVAGGTLTFTLTINALTQPVVQHHAVRWSLKRFSGEDAPASGNAGSR